MGKVNHEKRTGVGSQLRKSAAREAILSVLRGSKKPVPIFAIGKQLSQMGKIFNKTTLYREIEILKQLGNVREVFFRDGVALYELSGKHHHHLVCLSCGDVRDVTLKESLEREEKNLERRERFSIAEHALEFFGWCHLCR